MAAEPDPHLAALPVRTRPLLEKQWPWWADILAHPDRDEFWRYLSVADRFEDITVPALNIGGWFDIFVSSTTRTFTAMKKRGGSAEARDGQRLIIGPWDHLNSTGIYPDRKFGLMADALYADLTGAHLPLLRPVAAGQADALAGSAPVRIFVMGLDQWRTSRTGRCLTPLTSTTTCTALVAPTPRMATASCARSRPATSMPMFISTTHCGPFPRWAGG